MNMDSALFQIFKNAHPEKSDDEIQTMIAGTANAPEAARQDIGTQLSVSPDVMDIKPPVNTPSSFDVQDSTHTVTQNGSPASVAPVPTTVEPIIPAPEISAPVAPILPTPAPVVASKTPSKPVASKPDSLSLDITANAPTSSKDNDARNAMLADEEKRRKLNMIPTLLAGAADTVGTGARAFGVNAPTDALEKLTEQAHTNFEKSKSLFDDKIKNDPNSDVSKSYRQMVLQIAPQLAKQPAFQNMSAQTIGDKLPLIETMMKAQAQKDNREMGLKQLQANKDMTLGLKEDQQQDKLEHDYTQQLVSVRGDPNISALEKQRDAAAQAYNLIRDSQGTGKDYNLSEPQMVELYGQLYTAMTGRGLTAEAQHAMNQATGKQKLASLATFIGMSPSATTTAIGDRLKHMTTTLGTQVQSNLDKRMAQRMIPPSGLAKDRADRRAKEGRGFSFGELVEQSNKRAMGGENKPKLEKDSLGLF